MNIDDRTFNEIVATLRLADKERDWNDRRAYPRVPMQKCMAIIPYRAAQAANPPTSGSATFPRAAWGWFTSGKWTPTRSS